MKKTLSLILVFILTLTMSVPSFAVTPRWTNTISVAIGHCYDDGSALCNMIINAVEGAIVTNVDIKLEIVIGSTLIPVEEWNDLSSSGKVFTFTGVVPNVSNIYVYRMSYTAEITRNGVTDYLADYLDVHYLTNTKID